MPKLQAIPSGGRAGGRGRRVSTTLAEINVIPLVDIMLVLLIIFMITAPMIQRGADVKVPVAVRNDPIAGERVFVTIPLSYRQNKLILLGDGRKEEPVREEYLQERVRQTMETAGEKQVFLRGDAEITYQELMNVFDKLKAAGVRNIGMISRRPGER